MCHKKSIAVFFLLLSYSAFANTHQLSIALVAPFSGPLAAYGKQLLAGASQAVVDINEANSHLAPQLKLIPLDDKCQTKLARQVANQITENPSIFAVVGHTCSSASLATAHLYERANKLMITPTSTNPKLTQKGIPTLFRMCGRDDLQAMAAAEFMLNQLNSKRIAILHDQDTYGRDLADYTNEHIANLGRAPILYQSIPINAKRFKSLLKKFRQLEVDAVYFPGFYPTIGALAKEMHSQHLQIPLITSDGSALPAFIKATQGKKSANAIMMTFHHDPEKMSANRYLVEKMQQQRLETSGYALYAYAAIQAIQAARVHTQTTDAKQLGNWLHHNIVNTVIGQKTWDTNGDIIDSDYNVHIWDNKGNFNEIKLAKK